MSLIISTSNGSVFWVFYDYFSLISNYFCAVTAFVLLLYIFFQRFLKPQRGFFLYSLSINRVGCFLSINREKIRLFPLDSMRTNF